MSGSSRGIDRSVQLAGIPKEFLSPITLTERNEDVTEVTMRALFSTQGAARRGDGGYGADECGRETLGR